MASVVAAICARGGSKGVHRKNIRLLGGKPSIVYAIEQALDCGKVDRVVVSTDDLEIARIAQEYGAEVPFMRPPELARDDSPKWPVFQHLIQALQEEAGSRIEVLVDLDVGTPLRAIEDIQGAIDALVSSDADVVVTAYEAERNPYFNMVEGQGEYVQLVKSAGRTVARRQDAPKVFSLTPAVFAMRRDFVLSASHWSEGKVKIFLVPRERAIDIDHELDFLFVEYLMTKESV